jgi:hypothetical protein
MSNRVERRMEDDPEHDEADNGQLEEVKVGCSPGLGDLAHGTTGSRKGWGSAAQYVEH